MWSMKRVPDAHRWCMRKMCKPHVSGKHDVLLCDITINDESVVKKFLL